MALWQGFAVLLIVWMLFLVMCLVYLVHSAGMTWGRWGRLFTERLAADRRANALMREMLSAQEYQQLVRHGYVEIASPSIPQRTYRVPGAGGLVRVYEHGHAVMDLCLQPVEALPEGDVVLMHKLMIEGDEQEYLAKANHFAPGIITLRVGYL
jgi:hypothetical protein